LLNSWNVWPTWLVDSTGRWSRIHPIRKTAGPGRVVESDVGRPGGGWADAGSALGLNVADAKDIADAADDLAWSGVDGERFPDRELGALRFRLLEIVGLTSSPKPQDWRSEAENRSST
jgi:hypothetical protein